MLNVSSPALFDGSSSNNVTMDNMNKKNASMMGLTDPSSRPTLCNDLLNSSNDNDNLSFEEEMKKTTYEFKIILLGSIAVGKTAILTRYITNEFDNDHKCTIKIDFKTKTININNAQAKLHIWDTCGDEKFRAITRNYYRDAQGILLVYDITNRKSFENIINWHNEIKNNAPEDSVLFLVGNKIDLNKERVITNQEGKKKAEELEMHFTEVSAKDGDNIHILFEKISEAIMTSLENAGKLVEKNNNNKFLVENKENDQDEKEKKKCFC